RGLPARPAGAGARARPSLVVRAVAVGTAGARGGGRRHAARRADARRVRAGRALDPGGKDARRGRGALARAAGTDRSGGDASAAAGTDGEGRVVMRRFWDRLGLGSKPLIGWTLYDWANSAFYTIVVTAVYPVFFGRYAAAGAPEGQAAVRHANATTLALVVVAVLSPLLGVAADSLGAKKRLLGIFLAIGVVATAAMALVGQGQWQLASACFVFANIGIVGSLVFYDSLLPHVVEHREG